MLSPAGPAFFAQTPAFVVSIVIVRAAEVKGKVFFTAQVSAPGRFAAGTVVQSAQNSFCARVGGGLHHGVTTGRAAYGKGCVGRNTPCQCAGAHHGPSAAGLLHFYHADTVGGLGFAHLLGAPVVHATGVQQAVVGVFVVHGQQGALAACIRGQGIQVQAIVVHAHLHRLVGGAVAAVSFKGGNIAWHANGLAPRSKCGGYVALGHGDAVCAVNWDAFKADAVS